MYKGVMTTHDTMTTGECYDLDRVTVPAEAVAIALAASTAAGGEPVIFTYRDSLFEILEAECEGWDEGGPMTFWGTDVDGNRWEVRLA